MLDVTFSIGRGSTVARLGFSVAIHVLPEIIFLDEVLAVGDIAFQEKCMARILQLNNGNQTLLFVSHSPDAIKVLCPRTIWLHNGVVKFDGSTDEAIMHYQEFLGMGHG